MHTVKFDETMMLVIFIFFNKISKMNILSSLCILMRKPLLYELFDLMHFTKK